MKKLALGLFMAVFSGAAAAGDLSEPRYYESNDYSAQVYYRLDFGGSSTQAQSLGLRFDRVSAQAAGAPALFQASLNSQGFDRVALNGLDLRGPMLAAGQSEGGFFGSLSLAQWAALGFTAVVFGSVAMDATESDEATDGSGGS
jgi:hypothetical protein